MQSIVIERSVGRCSSRKAIRGWIDELLELRFAFSRIPLLVRDIDEELREAASWLHDPDARADCT